MCEAAGTRRASRVAAGGHRSRPKPPCRPAPQIRPCRSQPRPARRRARPFVLDALRAGVLNHSAAAAWLADEAGLDGDPDAIATALRRFREELSDYATADRAASVSMRSRWGSSTATASKTPTPSSASVAQRSSRRVVTPRFSQLGRSTLRRSRRSSAGFAAADVAVEAAGVAGETLVVVVGRRDGAIAVRIAEASLAVVPSQED